MWHLEPPPLVIWQDLRKCTSDDVFVLQHVASQIFELLRANAVTIWGCCSSYIRPNKSQCPSRYDPRHSTASSHHTCHHATKSGVVDSSPQICIGILEAPYFLALEDDILPAVARSASLRPSSVLLRVKSAILRARSMHGRSWSIHATIII